MLAGRAPAAVTHLVYDNAALVIEVATGMSYTDSRALAIERHRNGEGLRLLRRLQIVEHDFAYV